MNSYWKQFSVEDMKGPRLIWMGLNIMVAVLGLLANIVYILYLK